jgi:cytochrome c oxidase subunit II
VPRPRPGRGIDSRAVRRHPLAQMLLIGVVAAVVGTAITLNIDWFPSEGASSAHKIDTLYDVLLIASVPIFVLVMTVAIYSVVKFRARPGDMRDGAPIHGNTRLEIAWVTVPFILVSALAIYGWVVLNDLEAKKPNELAVHVVAQQFIWRFEYPKEKVSSPDLVLPKGRPVEFRINAKDVIHSFWVPEFRLKSDAVPGLTTKVRLTPDRVGNWEVVCAELCGLGHSTMRANVHVLPESKFNSWVSRKRGGKAPAGGGGGAAASGKQVFTSAGCGSCHALADAGSNGTTGPKLDNLASAAAKFGKKRGETPAQYVKESILDPRAFIVPGYPKVMPTTFNSQLSSSQVDALVKYLLNSRKGS